MMTRHVMNEVIARQQGPTHLLARAVHDLVVCAPNDTEKPFLARMFFQNVRGGEPVDTVDVPVVHTWIQEVARLGIVRA